MNDAYKNIFKTIMIVLVVIVIGLLLSIALSGCRTIEVTKEVPVVTEHVTEHHSVDIVRDTLYQRDSVYHFVQGDTVIIERWHNVVDVSKVIVADTVRDTIPRVVTVTRTEIREVNKPPWYQKALAWLGVLTLATGGAWLVLRLKK